MSINTNLGSQTGCYFLKKKKNSVASIIKWYSFYSLYKICISKVKFVSEIPLYENLFSLKFETASFLDFLKLSTCMLCSEKELQNSCDQYLSISYYSHLYEYLVI